MTTLALEIIAILLIAFVAGCVVGCVSRARLGTGERSGARSAND